MRTIPATRATLIFALEPVWASLFGAMAGEKMGPGAIGGAGLILAALFVSAFAARVCAHAGEGSGSFLKNKRTKKTFVFQCAALPHRASRVAEVFAYAASSRRSRTRT